LREGRGDAGEQVEDEEFEVSEAVLDIVAKDPQEQHIAEQMQPTAMHEHGREDRDRVCLGTAGKARRYESPVLDELVAAGKLDEEDQDIEADKDEGDVRHAPPLRVVVADREHAGALPR
jgi:hypothetical protein